MMRDILCSSPKFQNPNNSLQIAFSGSTMGNIYNVKYMIKKEEFERLRAEEIKAYIEKTLSKINQQMSIYQTDSEISQFNQMQSTHQQLPISDNFAHVINEAIRLNKLTKGGLDITLGPLVNLWGFGPLKPTATPKQNILKQYADLVGMDKLQINNDGNGYTLSKKHPELYIDLSSIAKGFGVDQMAKCLDEKGISNYLVDIGGEIRTKGQKNPETPWCVGIEAPDNTGSIAAAIVLQNSGLATSGSYRIQRQVNDGNTISHVLNPLTYIPVENDLLSVSVVAESVMQADGIATGLFALGSKQARQIAEENNLAVFLITSGKNGKYENYISKKFEPLLLH